MKARIVGREEGFRGFYRLERISVVHDLFGGGCTPPLVREVVSRGDIAAVLPYDPANDCFLLVEQFRAGALVAGGHPWLVEIVAGYVEPGESPEEAARRESAEELGCAVSRLARIATHYLAPNFSPDRVHLFAAAVDAAAAAAVCGRADEEEDIRVLRMARSEALALAARGAITTPWALLALALFEPGALRAPAGQGS